MRTLLGGALIAAGIALAGSGPAGGEVRVVHAATGGDARTACFWRDGALLLW